MATPSLHERYIAKLEEENSDLRAKVKELERQIGLRDAMPLLFGLTSSESRILSMLYTRGSANKEQLLIACSNDVTGNNMPEIKIVDVYVCKIRKKLERFGIVIETVWGRGYNIDAENRAKIGAYLGNRGVSDGTVLQHATGDGRLPAASG